MDITTTNVPKISNSFSQILTIIYIGLYVLILLVIGMIVKLQSGITLCSFKYFKAFWIQKSIYLGLLIHVYDTATDIGVLIDWYQLWKNERNGFNYDNIDMKVFFWCGIASLILYKIVNIYVSIRHNCNPIIMGILSIFELSIFVFIYDSFNDVQSKMNEYYEIEKKKHQLKHQMKSKIQLHATNSDIKSNIPVTINNKLSAERTETLPPKQSLNELNEQIASIIKNIKPSDGQFWIQFFEGIFESMPQMILQSVFLVRSYNTSLGEDSNLILVIISLIGSVLSISTKLIANDTDLLSSTTNKRCNIWYFVRVFWRISNILSRALMLSLIWTVIGGAIFVIYIGLSVLYNIVVSCCIHDNKYNGLVFGIVHVLLLSVLSPKNCLIIIMRSIDHLMVLVSVTLFTIINIECNICVDVCQRTLNYKNNSSCDNNGQINDLLFIFIIAAWIIYGFDVFLTIIIMKLKPDMFKLS